MKIVFTTLHTQNEPTVLCVSILRMIFTQISVDKNAKDLIFAQQA